MPGDNNSDFLTNAVQANAPLPNLLAPHPDKPPETQAPAWDAGIKAAAAAELTKEKLAQEALLADPAEMRKLFPQVLKDVSVNHNDHLDMYEIQQGVQNGNLSQEDRNFLKVLEYGYDNFCWEPTISASFFKSFDHDINGVSAGSLAMLDKAEDRKIPEDPYFSYALKPTVISSLVLNGLVGAGVSKYLRDDDPKTVALFAALSALGGTAWNVGRLYVQRSNGTEDKMYDQIKTGYDAFVSDYKNGKAQKPKPSNAGS